MLTAFIVVQVVILLILLLHDWVPLGPFNDLTGNDSQVSVGQNILATLGNVAPVLIALFLAWRYHHPYPIAAKVTLILAYGLLCIGAFMAWWRDYFFGASQEKSAQYEGMFGKTHTFLPRRGHAVVPNTLHVILHSFFLMALVLSIII